MFLCAFMLVGGFFFVNKIEAGYTVKKTHYYNCRAHSTGVDMYVTLAGYKNNGKFESAYFSDIHTHWPNGVNNMKTWKQNNNREILGQYTIYSSIVTQWASIAFKSTTKTITAK